MIGFSGVEEGTVLDKLWRTEGITSTTFVERTGLARR